MGSWMTALSKGKKRWRNVRYVTDEVKILSLRSAPRTPSNLLVEKYYPVRAILGGGEWCSCLQGCSRGEVEKSSSPSPRSASRALSIYEGVSKDNTKSNPWKATITLDGQPRSLGCYKYEEDAARAYTTAYYLRQDGHGDLIGIRSRSSKRDSARKTTPGHSSTSRSEKGRIQAEVPPVPDFLPPIPADPSKKLGSSCFRGVGWDKIMTDLAVFH